MYQRTYLLKLILPLVALVFSSCATSYKVSNSANIAQVLLGRPTKEAVDLFGIPKYVEGNAKNGRAIWSYYKEYDVQHYVPGYTTSRASYDYWTDTVTVRTVSTPGYTYHTTDIASYRHLLNFKNGKIVSIDYYIRGLTMGRFTDWREANKGVLLWNAYIADDELKEVKKREIEYPNLASPEMRLKGCLQAAKFDSLDVLVYYLKDCGVPLDTKAETWAYAEHCTRNPQGNSDSLVLTEATVREILTAKATPKVIKKLQKLGLL